VANGSAVATEGLLALSKAAKRARKMDIIMAI
jgi:hypothetical protein